MAWLYDVFSVRTLSALLGVVELSTAALIAIKPWRHGCRSRAAFSQPAFSSPP